MIPKNKPRFHVNLDDTRILIITGVCRSGKTTLAKLISTMKDIIYVDEPWLPMMLPIMNGTGMIDKESAKTLSQSFTKELLNDAILLRNANFRPNDLSAIWNYKDPKEIFERLILLESRDDVKKYIKEKKPVLMYVLAETNTFIQFFIDTYPGCKIIHVIRNAVDVASDTKIKEWFADKELKKPTNMIPYMTYKHKNSTYYLPWWVEQNKEKEFIEMSNFNRGLIYWKRLLEKNKKHRELHPNQYKEIKFENLLNNPDDIIKDISDYIKKPKTAKTDLFRKKLKKKKNINQEKVKKEFKQLPEEERRKINIVLTELNYETIR